MFTSDPMTLIYEGVGHFFPKRKKNIYIYIYEQDCPFHHWGHPGLLDSLSVTEKEVPKLQKTEWIQSSNRHLYGAWGT